MVLPWYYYFVVANTSPTETTMNSDERITRGSSLKAKCDPCGSVFRWNGKPLVRDAKCPICGRALARTTWDATRRLVERALADGRPLVWVEESWSKTIRSRFGRDRIDYKGYLTPGTAEMIRAELASIANDTTPEAARLRDALSQWLENAEAPVSTDDLGVHDLAARAARQVYEAQKSA